MCWVFFFPALIGSRGRRRERDGLEISTSRPRVRPPAPERAGSVGRGALRAKSGASELRSEPTPALFRAKPANVCSNWLNFLKKKQPLLINVLASMKKKVGEMCRYARFELK